VRTVLDVENNSQKIEGKTILDPWQPGNILVQVGTLNVDNTDEMHILNFDHTEAKDTTGGAAFVLQALLRRLVLITLLVMNLLNWMLKKKKNNKS
jgi:ABC-type sulfate transport system permease subunit